MEINRSAQKGIALTIVIMTVMLVVLFIAAALSIGYNQKKVADNTVTNRTQAFYYAQAGVVDAQYRLGANDKSNITLSGSGCTGTVDFTNANCAATYWINLSTNPPTFHTLQTSGDNVRVTINAAVSGQRTITATGTK